MTTAAFPGPDPVTARMNAGRPARFGFTAGPGTTDDARLRHLTLALPPQHAARLFDAQDRGTGEQQLRDLAAEALGEVYFRDGGRRATGLEVQFTDVEHVEFDLWPHRIARAGLYDSHAVTGDARSDTRTAF